MLSCIWIKNFEKKIIIYIYECLGARLSRCGPGRVSPSTEYASPSGPGGSPLSTEGRTGFRDGVLVVLVRVVVLVRFFNIKLWFETGKMTKSYWFCWNFGLNSKKVKVWEVECVWLKIKNLYVLKKNLSWISKMTVSFDWLCWNFVNFCLNKGLKR